MVKGRGKDFDDEVGTRLGWSWDCGETERIVDLQIS